MLQSIAHYAPSLSVPALAPPSRSPAPIGNCSVWFVVMHVNKDYEFRYISKPHNQVLHSFILPAPDYPLFAYLAPTKRPNELQLVWTLRALTNGEARYGTDPANLKHLATAKAWQEPYRDKCKV